MLARSVLCLISEQTCSCTLAARRMASLESETYWIFFFAPDPITVLTIFSAHGLISFSAIDEASNTSQFDMPPRSCIEEEAFLCNVL